jgi:acyl-CoA thioester hydrolase
MHEIQVKVRFCETDALGHINNASYFVYLEEARIRYFEHLGYNMSMKGWNFILASATCDFLSQGYFNQTLTIKTYVSRIGTKSFTLGHDIVSDETQEVIARGSATIVFFDFEKQQSTVIPDYLREGLNKSLVQL